MTTFLIVSTVLFSLLFLIWKSSDWVNVFIKVLFFGMMLFGIFFTFQALGYIVKAV